MLLLYVLFRLQERLPAEPRRARPAVDKYVAFNTASSFTTNTNWQAYGGESTMSYLSQMLGLTVQNFVSAAVGMAVLVALFRGFTRRARTSSATSGATSVRGIVYILIPLVGRRGPGPGDPRRRADARRSTSPATGIQGFEQTLARGPVAGQIAIKQLGTNGGGFFNVNSAHPFEGGVGPFGNFIEMFSILLIPAALTYTFGKMVGNKRQGWALFAVMYVLFIGGLPSRFLRSTSSSGAMRAAGISASAPEHGGEGASGSEPTSPSLWAVATTDASNGSVNSMHDSYRPLGASRADVQHGDR